jgi:type IV pilus assembly protein PilC
MAETFAYRVRDRSGSIRTGTVDADTRSAVAARLREQGMMPIEITAQAAKTGVRREITLGGRKKVKLKDLAVFSRQFATMVNSGLSLLRSLNILSEQTESKDLARVIGEVRNDVERGSSLSEALSKHPKAYDNLYVAMVRAGEAGGVLDQVLLRLAETIEAKVALRQKVRSAMTYPIVVFVMVILILTAMLLFVVPMFENLYSELGGILPLPTRILLAVSGAVSSWFGLVIFAVLVGLAFGFRRYAATERGRYQLDALMLKAPIFGPLFHKIALARFARTLAVLMRTGVPILQALEIVSETVGNGVMAKAILDVQRSVKEGESIAKPLESHAVFPPMVVQMMAVGEETGALDTMLNKIAEFYEQEIEATVESLTSLIEPVMIAVMGATVGSMVVALYLPMFNIINLIQ